MGEYFSPRQLMVEDAALAFDWQGKALWQRTLGAEVPGKSKWSSGCNSSIVPCHEAQGGRPELDGIRLGGAGDVTATHRAWRQQKTTADVPTPAEYNGRVFVLGDRGEVECLDPATGGICWQGALPKASASFFASPVVAGGKLYAAREDGVVFVAQVQDKFEVLAENRMGEQIIASPVAVSNRLLIRGEHHLFCIGER